MNDEVVKHLEFIQNSIERMNQNAFHVKGWMIAIVSALLALYASNGNVLFIAIAIVPVIICWFLDAYYLQLERKFRGIYNDVAMLSAEDSRVIVRLFEMPLHKYQCGKYCYLNILFSKTVVPLYLPVFVGLIIAWIKL